MPDLRELDLNQPNLAAAAAYMINKHARWIMLTDRGRVPLNSCIFGTMLSVHLMRHYGVRNARPLPVQLVAGNPTYARLVEETGEVPSAAQGGTLDDWVDQGAFVMGIIPGGPETEETWSGHLVCVAERIMLDLTADQVNKPQHNLEAENFAMPVTQKFLDAEESAAVLAPNGSLLMYWSTPENQGWKLGMDANVRAPDLEQKIIAAIDEDPAPELLTAVGLSR